MSEEVGRVPRLNIWREITILSVMIMEVSWGGLWLQVLSPPLRNVMASNIFLDFLGTTLIAHLLARLLNRLNLKKNLHRGLVVGLIILAGWTNLRILLAGLGETKFTDFLTQPIKEVSATGRLVPPEIWILTATLILIWRGFSLAKSWGGRETVFSTLLWGIGFYAIYGIVSSFTHQSGAMWLLFAFISAALLAMVTARVSTLVRMRGGTHSPFDWRWVWSILSAAIGVTGVAAFISGMMSRQVGQLNGLLRWVLYGIISLFVLPIAYLLKLGEPAIQAVQGIIPTPTPVPQLPAWEQGLETSAGSEVVNEIPDAGGSFLPIVQAILIGLAVIILLILVLRLANSWQLRHDREVLDERQSLLEGTSLWDALVNALRNRIFKTAGDLSAATRLRRKERLRAAARIRRIYVDFMDLCSDLGQPRPEPITPLEFLPAAVKFFGGLDGELETITGSYLRVRYGELPETHQEVEIVETAWKRVSDQGALIKKQAQN